MTSRCRTFWTASHPSEQACELCGQVAVFHWRETYPDLFLCRTCLEAYPEAYDARSRPSYDPFAWELWPGNDS